MSFTMEDSLESGWVAVRPNVFDEKEKHKFVFIVAWNEIEGKFAVTCHNRTVQKLTAFRDTLFEVGESDVAFPAPPSSEKHKHGKTSPKSPTKRKDEMCTTGKIKSSVSAKGNVEKSTVRDKLSMVRTPKPSKCVSDTLGTWDFVSTKVMDIEVLEPVDVPGAPRSPDYGDLDDAENGSHEDYSWARLFSFQDLRAAHLQLCAVNSDLEPCLPPFPEEQSGMWTVLFGATEVSQRETEALCYQLQVYLGHALDTCGWKILSQVLFSESEDTDEYYESLSELRHKGYEDALQRAKKRLQEVNKTVVITAPILFRGSMFIFSQW